MTVEEVPLPVPGPGEVRIRVSVVGICGSELSGYLGQNSLRVPPLVMGHEFAGTVAATGAGVTALSAGDRVTVNPLIACGQCPMCRRGLPMHCARRAIVGVHRPGAFAEQVVVPADACVQLPDAISDAAGALAEPLACGIRAVRRAGIGMTDTTVIFGAGPIGLLTLLAARQAGAGTVAVVDTNPRRLAVARQWGATLVIDPHAQDPVAAVRAATEGVGADSAVDCVGLPITRQQSVRAVRPQGTVVLSGLHHDATEFPGNTIVRGEIQITGAFCYTWDDFGAAIQMLAAGRVQPSPVWVDERPLEASKESFDELIDQPTAVAKVLLRP